jgi:formate dehydrogenase major subunit
VVGPEGGRIKVKARVTEAVPVGTICMPFNFGGAWMGKSLRDKYPEGSQPYVVGESSNIVMTYGYDPVTCMQETKATLCRIEKA